MLDSTLWVDRGCRELFITSLLMAEPREFKEEQKQIEIGALNYTGFAVPPGWYGFVAAASQGIIARALIDRDAGTEALKRLGEPDPDSRSCDYEGRRMIRVDGGFLVLNYMKYRDHDYTSALRSKRYRERLKSRDDTRDGDGERRDITHAEAYADSRKQKKEEREARAPRSAPARRLPEDFELTPERRAMAETEKADPDREFAAFTDYWRGASGAKARKHDWDGTWRNWCRRATDYKPARGRNPNPGGDPNWKAPMTIEEAEARERARESR